MVTAYIKTKNANISFPLRSLSFSVAIWESSFFLPICESSKILEICQKATPVKIKIANVNNNVIYKLFI